MTEWISVEERLPEREILAIDDRENYLVGMIYRSNDDKRWVCEAAGVLIYPVTHWMPLPEPPEEKP